MHDYLTRLYYLENPEIYEVNRLTPHSDHEVFGSDGQPLPALDLCGEWEIACYQLPELVDTDLIASGNLSETVHVPGHLQLQGYGVPKYVNTQYPWDGIEALIPPEVPKAENLTALYIKNFVLRRSHLDGRLRLILEGVESCCFVYLNGDFIGYSEDSFSPAEFDISNSARDGENRIAIIVPQFCSGSWLEDQDFWRLSGIFRSIRIVTDPSVRMDDLQLATDLDQSLKKGYVNAKLRVFSPTKTKFILFIALENGSYATQIDGELLEGSQTLEASIEVINPELWSAETPNLYTCAISLRVGSFETEQMVRQEIGFRRVEITDGVILLNGQRLVFRGVNRHEWNCKTGRALSNADIERDIILMKQNNINAVRTSHYPNQSYFYRLCDQYGIYVIDEVNLETHGTWMVSGKVRPTEHTLPGNHPQWQESVLARAESMFERDKNHPSILLWSCGNESFGGETIFKISEWLRAHDSSRLIHYEGIYFDRTFEATSDVESRMYAKPHEARKYLEENKDKPLILCEYAHAMGNSFGNVDEYVALEDEFRQYQGGFIWDWIDQAIDYLEPEGKHILRYGGDFGDRPTDWNFCGNGLLFSNRNLTPKMDEAKWLYAPYRILCDRTGVTIKNRMMFSGSEAYLFEWSLLEDGIPVQSETFTLAIPAGATVRKALELQTEQLSGEVVLRCRAILAWDLKYAHAGHETAYGNCVIRDSRITEQTHRPAQLVRGDVNIGARMKNFNALIRKENGMLYSIKGKEEFLLGLVQPEFWRAPTDNDFGNGALKQWAAWKIASLYRDFLGMEINEQEASILLRFSAPANPAIRYSVAYLFDQQDRVRVTLRLEPIKTTLPCFGLSLVMPSSFDRINWYGNLAREASCDRQSSAWLGRGEAYVKDQLTPYLRPQDCGNKTMVRELSIKNKEDNGIRFFADEPFEASALHYSCHELEHANHIEELPPAYKTVVSLFLKKCGVGGDDSWGAPVHDAYQISAENGLEFTIWMQMNC